MKLKIILLSSLFFIILLFLNYDIVLSSSLAATNIWLTKVFPFLFIMFTISDILINLNLNKIFKTATPFIFLLSFLSGAPSNAFVIGSLYHEKQITKENANTYLLFTYFANPLFMYATLNSIFIPTISLKIILWHYLSNFIIYLLVRKKIKNNPITITITKKTSFNLGSSIKKSLNTLIMILGTITFFMVLSNISTHIFHLNNILTLFLKGFFEVTQGLNYLSEIVLNSKIKEIIASVFISFGGLSIHSQVATILKEENLNYKVFLKGRLMQALIATIFTSMT